MIIETNNLSKRFLRHEAVKGVNLSVPEGAAMALIGSNGAGKTTTLRLLMNLLRPGGGEAKVLGVDSRRLTAAQYARIGYVSENQKLPEGLTVGQFFDYLRPLYPTWDRALEDEIRTNFDLPSGRRLGKLSHGMRVKAALAAALPFRPSLLVLDEPLSGLDPLVRDEVMEGLLNQAGEMTIIISSHELTEIEGCATHVAFMDKGRLQFQDTMDNLGARFREVTAVAASDLKPSLKLPDTWLTPKRSGHTLRFVTAGYTDHETLARDVAAQLGPLEHIAAEPMNLRDISKALMRANRKDAAQ